MSVYAVARITIRDKDAYAVYEAGFMDVFSRFNGRLLAVDDAPQIIEGTAQQPRMVLLEFPSEAAFRDWYESDAYQDIAQIRFAAADSEVMLIQALPG